MHQKSKQNLHLRNSEKYFNKLYHNESSKAIGQRENNVDLDEVAHYELPQLDLHCWQNQLFSLSGAFLAFLNAIGLSVNLSQRR